jgi:hypothetical protein
MLSCVRAVALAALVRHTCGQAAVLIEPRFGCLIHHLVALTFPSNGRTHLLLPRVVENFAQNLPGNWTIYIYHGTENADFIQQSDSLMQFVESGKVKLHDLQVANLNMHDFNTLLTSPSFWSGIAEERILLFQTDTVCMRALVCASIVGSARSVYLTLPHC